MESLSLSLEWGKRSPCQENHCVWQAQHTGSHHGGHIVEGRVPPLRITIPGDWQPVINALCSRMSILLHMLLHRITPSHTPTVQPKCQTQSTNCKTSLSYLSKISGVSKFTSSCLLQQLHDGFFFGASFETHSKIVDAKTNNLSLAVCEEKNSRGTGLSTTLLNRTSSPMVSNAIYQVQNVNQKTGVSEFTASCLLQQASCNNWITNFSSCFTFEYIARKQESKPCNLRGEEILYTNPEEHDCRQLCRQRISEKMTKNKIFCVRWRGDKPGG